MRPTDVRMVRVGGGWYLELWKKVVLKSDPVVNARQDRV